MSKLKLNEERMSMYLEHPESIMSQNNWSAEELLEEVGALWRSIVLSKRGKGSKNKGANYERVIAKKLQDKLGIEFKRTPLSGGFAKGEDAEDFRGDIIPTVSGVKCNLHIECKSCKKLSIPKWLEQSAEDCPEGRVPLVIFHKPNSSDEYVTLKSSDLLKLVREVKCDVKKIRKIKVKGN